MKLLYLIFLIFIAYCDNIPIGKMNFDNLKFEYNISSKIYFEKIYKEHASFTSKEFQKYTNFGETFVFEPSIVRPFINMVLPPLL